VLEEDLAQGIHWVRRWLTAAVFPEGKLEQQRQWALAALRAEKEQIFTVGKNHLRQQLYPTHPYRLNPAGSEESLQGISQEDLLVWYQSFVRPDRGVVVVSGENEEKCQHLVAGDEWSKVSDVCLGGRRRQDSVAAGLNRLNKCDCVIIHDGARPLVTVELVTSGYVNASGTTTGITVNVMLEQS